MLAQRIPRDYLYGVALVVLATCGWSLAGLFVRRLPGLDGWQINTWRGLSVGVALLAYLIVLYGRQTAARFRDIPPFAMLACAAFFSLGSTLYVTSLTLTSTANVSSIGAAAPIFTALLSTAVLREKPGPATWLATFLALAGVTVIMHAGLTAGGWAGNLAAILTALCFAGQTITLRRYASIDMVPAVCVGGLATFVLAGVVGGGFAVPRDAILVLALMGLVQLAIPLILFAKGARYVPAVALTLLALLDVVLNPFWAWLGAGEAPELAGVIGGSIILGAAALSVVAGRRMAARAPISAPASACGCDG